MKLTSLILLCAAAQAAVFSTGVEFRAADFQFSQLAEFAVVSAADLEVSDEPGRPQLPVKPVSIVLPGLCRVTNVGVRLLGWQELGSGQVPAPAQKQAVLSLAEGHETVTPPDQSVYQSSSPYPGQAWRVTGVQERDGNTVVEVLVYPVRYIGARQRLEYYPRVEIEVEYEKERDQGIKGTREQVSGLPDQSTFEYLIVTSAEFDSVFRRLAEWKTQKGVPAAIRHIDWILGTYPGRDNAERLRNYLKTVPDSGARYVLLGGDVSVVPHRTAFAMVSAAGLHQREDSLPCDLYFSNLDGTWDANNNNLFGEVADSVNLYPDLFVGRAPCDNLADAQAFVNKTLEYECGPARGPEADALFFAEILWQDPLTDMAIHKNKLEQRSFTSGYRVTKKYQSLGNETRESVMAAMRDGQNYLNHDGHGWIDVMSCGGGSGNRFRTADADTITNAYRGIIFSIGCWTTAFDFVSVGEALVTNPRGGTVATVGNSSYGWGSPGNPGFGYSDRFDNRFWYEIQNAGETHVGAALAISKAYFVPFSQGENVYRWHQYQLNLMGCPEMPVWTSLPETLVVSAPPEIPAKSSRVLVTVASAGGAVENALVCLAKDSESYARARTDAAGRAWLETTPETTGDFTLTVTAQNCLPYEATIPVAGSAYLNFIGWTIDDSAGNGDGIVNQNERVRLPVWMHNAGPSAIGGRPLKLRSAETIVQVLDSTAFVPPLSAGDSALVTDAFEIRTGACSQDGRLIRFELAVEDTDLGRVFFPVLQVGRPMLELERYYLTQPPLLPGETKDLKVAVDNNGLGYGHAVWARLVSLDPYVTVAGTDSIGLGEIPPGMLVRSPGQFQVEVSGSCPGSYRADMELRLAGEEYTFQYQFQLLIGPYGFADDMESGEAKWSHGGTGDRWHRSDYRYHGGTNAWYCGDEGERRYYDNTDAWLLSTPFMVAQNCSLAFWRWFSVPNYGVDGIYAIVVRAGGADTLDFIGTGGALARRSKPSDQSDKSDKSDTRLFLTGIVSDWYEERYALDWLAPGETVQVKIAFRSDADGQYGEGFYIDDVAVTGGNPPPIFVFEPEPRSGGPFRIAVHPNPAHGAVRLQAVGVRDGRLDGAVFDAGGRKLRDFAAVSRNGRVIWNWDGTDVTGRQVGAGTYFVRLSSGDEAGIGRVILLR